MEERHKLEFREQLDVDLAYAAAGLARFRVNVFREANGYGAALRQIPGKILTLEQLGMPEILGELCTIPKGLILVTGPTGSGKSTTLAAMVDRVNGPATPISSLSRIRSSSFIRRRSAWSPSARSAATPAPSRGRSARTPT